MITAAIVIPLIILENRLYVYLKDVIFKVYILEVWVKALKFSILIEI